MTEQRKDWFGRNWKWFIPVICLSAFAALALFFGLLIFGVQSMLKNSSPYQKAVTMAKSDPRVIAALGTPVTIGWFATGGISVYSSTGQGATGKAKMAIPIQGPKAKGTIYVVASEAASNWTFSKLVVHVTKTDEDIDLTDTNNKIAVPAPTERN